MYILHTMYVYVEEYISKVPRQIPTNILYILEICINGYIRKVPGSVPTNIQFCILSMFVFMLTNT